jgi:hypothetical protein
MFALLDDSQEFTVYDGHLNVNTTLGKEARTTLLYTTAYLRDRMGQRKRVVPKRGGSGGTAFFKRSRFPC